MRNNRRPILSIPHTSLEATLKALTVLCIIALIAITIWGWSSLPATIPTHFGISGKPNAYGGKESLLLLPVIAIGLTILFGFLMRYPHSYNYPWPITEENAPRQYYLARLLLRWVLLEMVAMFCGLQWMLIQAAYNHDAGLILLFVLVPVAILFATIFVYLRIAARFR